MPVLAHRLGVPRRPVLAAAADVGQHVGAAAGQPQPPERTGVARRVGDLEPAVAAEQCRSWTGRTAPPSELRCPTTKYGILVPSADATKCCVTSMSDASKNAGCALDFGRHRCPRGPTTASTVCRNRWSPGTSRRRTRRCRLERCWCWAGCRGSPRAPTSRRHQFHVAGHVDERDEHKVISRPRVVLQAGVRVRFEDDAQFSGAGEEFVISAANSARPGK